MILYISICIYLSPLNVQRMQKGITLEAYSSGETIFQNSALAPCFGYGRLL